MILWVFVIAIRSSEVLLLNTKFRKLYVILVQSTNDMIPFSVIFFYMIFSIALISRTKAMNKPSVTDWGFSEDMGSVLGSGLSFGDSPLANFGTKSGIEYGEWVLFVLSVFIMNILILNSLIAILGDSYEKVQQDNKLYESQQKMPLLKNINTLFSLCNSKKGKRKYIHLFTYDVEGALATEE